MTVRLGIDTEGTHSTVTVENDQEAENRTPKYPTVCHVWPPIAERTIQVRAHYAVAIYRRHFCSRVPRQLDLAVFVPLVNRLSGPDRRTGGAPRFIPAVIFKFWSRLGRRLWHWDPVCPIAQPLLLSLSHDTWFPL